MLRATIPTRLNTGGGVIVNAASRATLALGAGAVAFTDSKSVSAALTEVRAVEDAKADTWASACCPGSRETPTTSGVAFLEGVEPRLLHRMMSIARPRGPVAVVEPTARTAVAATIAYPTSDDPVHVDGNSVMVHGAAPS